MAVPSSRDTFKAYCLRRLGFPVIEINVDEDQVDDRVNDALKYYADYHFDGSEKVYYKHQVTANNKGDAIYSISVDEAGSGYSNSDTVVFSGGGGGNAAAGVVTNANGSIVSVSITDNGAGYAVAPTCTISTSGGTGAEISATLGGFIELPDNILGAVSIFDMSAHLSSGNMFSIQYQMALNDIWSLTSFQLHPYYIMRSHLELIHQMLVGTKPIRYNRHRNRLHIDMVWSEVLVGSWIIVEAYQVVDPDEFTDVWGDRWLAQYATALIKRQWGANLSKFSGMQLPGGITFNGLEIYNQAIAEIDKLEQEMITSFSLPNYDMMG